MPGSWQAMVIDQAVRLGKVAFTEVMPRGKAAAYASRYRQSFANLHGHVEHVNGTDYLLKVGPFGPKGGLGIIAETVQQHVDHFIDFLF